MEKKEMDTDSLASKVHEETLRFRAALPVLMEEHNGRWVVYLDGEVKSAHDTEDEAFGAGLEEFGLFGGHVVALVREQEPVPLTAGIAFGLA